MKNLNTILKKCLSQDRIAQQQLYSYTYTHLCAAVAVYSKDNSEKDWVFNLGMLKIFKGLSKFEPNSNYLGWARTILVRSAIDHIRSNKKHSKNLSPIEIETQHVSSDDFNNIMNNLETEAIIELLQGLPERERMVFSMNELDGYTHKDIEELTAININTSKWLLAKAKKTLRSMINNSQDFKMLRNGK